MATQPTQKEAAELEAAQSGAKSGTKRTVAQYKGHVGTKRVISKADQDKLTGVPGVAKEDLVWEASAGPRNVDVTDVDEAVLDYLKGDSSFTLREVEVPAQS